jgi:hypothetical protein
MPLNVEEATPVKRSRPLADCDKRGSVEAAAPRGETEPVADCSMLGSVCAAAPVTALGRSAIVAAHHAPETNPVHEAGLNAPVVLRVRAAMVQVESDVSSAGRPEAMNPPRGLTLLVLLVADATQLSTMAFGFAVVIEGESGVVLEPVANVVVASIGSAVLTPRNTIAV